MTLSALSALSEINNGGVECSLGLKVLKNKFEKNFKEIFDCSDSYIERAVHSGLDFLINLAETNNKIQKIGLGILAIVPNMIFGASFVYLAHTYRIVDLAPILSMITTPVKLDISKLWLIPISFIGIFNGVGIAMTEEVMFREIFQNHILKKVFSYIPGLNGKENPTLDKIGRIGIATLVFSAQHYWGFGSNWNETKCQMIHTLSIGLIAGTLYEAHGFLACSAFHGGYNALVAVGMIVKASLG